MDFARSLRASPRSGRTRSQGRRSRAEPGRRTAWAALASFALFALFGGSGAPFPALLLPLEVLGLTLLGGLLFVHLMVRRIALPVWPGGVLLLAMVLVVAVQFLPVPWSVWQTLPGRELAVAALTEAGLGNGWRPLAIAPAHVRSAAITLLPAVAVFLLAASLDFDRRMQLVRVAVAVAAISALLGLLQFLAPGRPYLYLSPRAVFDLPSGIFANRNFQATFLLVAMILTPVALAAGGRPFQRGWLVPLFALFAVAVLATRSRFGFIGLVVTLPAVIYASSLLHREIQHSSARATGRGTTSTGRAGWSGKAGRWALFGGLGLIAALFFATVMLERFQIAATADRGSELRVAALPDLLLAMGAFFPLGAGLGSFEPIFRNFESLEIVSPPYFNHAHNDYIELVIELGLIGVLLPLVFIAACAGRVWRAVADARAGERQRGTQQKQRLAIFAAAAGLALMLAHSLADYPLRTITLECLFALLAAILLIPEPQPAARRGARPPRGRGARVVVGGLIAVAVVAGGVVIARTQLARQAVQAKAGPAAYLADSANPDALALQAELFFAAGQTDRATAFARGSIDAFPLKPVGLRVLGLARNATRPGTGDSALTLAAALGWRDLPVQSWVLERGMLSREWRAAMLRAEAMTRLGAGTSTTYSLMSLLAIQPSARERLIASLSRKPTWRQQFLTNDDPRTPEQRRGMAQVLAALAHGSAPPTLAEARPTIDGMARENSVAEAAALYRTVVPQRQGTAANLLWDGGFALNAGDYEPGPQNTVFDWRVYASEASFGAVEKPADHSQALVLIGRSGDEGRLAERLMVLLPGTYRLAWNARRDTPDEAGGLVLIVRCENGPEVLTQPLTRGLTDRWQPFAVTFTVPAQGCSSQTLSLAARGISPGQQPAMYLDDLVLRVASVTP